VSKKVVIVGAGHAAGQCVATLRQNKFDGQIVLLGEESWYPYQRPPLSKKYLAGELAAERLYFKPESFYTNVDVRLETRASRIDRSERLVHTASGDAVAYDQLVIATGSRPRPLPVDGVDLPGVHYLRGIDDVQRIRDDMQDNARLVIVGAGYIGLEVAAVAAKLGLDVTVVEMEERVMRRVVSPELSSFYQGVHESHGVRFRMSTVTCGFVGEKTLEGVTIDSDEVIAADIVIIGIGVIPNIELAAKCGLETENGIVVDDHCRTSDENIFAVGDCTKHPNEILGCALRLESVHNALEQAKTAAANICGADLRYAQVPWFWSDQYDLKLQIAGISQGYDQVVMRGEPAEHSFACLYLRDGQLIAVDAVNRPKDFVQSKPMIARHARVSPELLADGTLPLKDMPDS
jgi:3-phenylpropionate/trans-cinnamate dioxygenase ferredoxin reductase subunit